MTLFELYRSMLSRALTCDWLGSIDKTFGLLFGFLMGYVVCVCLFSISNWFYPYQNWGISVEKVVSNFFFRINEIFTRWKFFYQYFTSFFIKLKETAFSTDIPQF